LFVVNRQKTLFFNAKWRKKWGKKCGEKWRIFNENRMTGIFISALGGRPAADKANELFTVQRLNQGRTEGTDFCSKISY